MSRLAAYRDPSRLKVPRTMKAVMLCGTGFENLHVREVPVPEPGPDQLLGRVDAAGVCSSLLMIIAQGSDYVLLNGWDLDRYPLILGDEGTVTLARIGANLLSQYKTGQRFAIQPEVNVAPRTYRHRYRDDARGIKRVGVGNTLPGYLAQYILITEEVLAGRCLVPLPDGDMPYFASSLAEPIACVHSSQERHIHFRKDGPLALRVPQAGPLQGGTTVVIGAGVMGRMQAEMAMSFRPGRILLSDIVTQRLRRAQRHLNAKAERLGIELITVISDRLKDIVTHVSDGSGADDVIMATGSPDALRAGMGILAKGGVVNLFSALPRGAHDFDLDSKLVHYDEVTLVGSAGGEPSDLAAALNAMVSGRLHPGDYVYGVGSLEHCPHVLKLMMQNQVNGKAILYPHVGLAAFQVVDGWEGGDERALLEQHLNSA